MRFGEILVFLAFLLGAAVFTYPMARDLRTAATDPMDPLLDAWAIAWIGHQIVEDPVHLFDSNRFYPEKGTLAYTDPILAIGIPLAPVTWLFGDALLTLNLGILLAIAISGYGAYRLGASLTGSRAAGAVGGSAFAFCAYRLTHLGHVQLQSAGFIPLLYLCLRRYLEEGRLRHAVGVAVFLWLVSASSAYYGLYSWVMLGFAIPYELWRTRTFFGKRLAGLGIALGLSGIAFLPIAIPIMNMGSSVGLERPLPRLQRASARPGDYLRSGSHAHGALGLPPPSPERTLFPGLTALGLSLIALAGLERRRALFAILAAMAFWASLGPAYGLYRVLYELVPGISGVRVPPRMSIYVFFALATLAAYGAAAVFRRFRRQAVVLAPLLIVLPLAETFAGPIPYARAPEFPDVYRWLATVEERVPVIELPLPPPKRQRDNAVYLYWSTAHFQPLANGYATAIPPVYAEIAESMKTFPDDAGIDRLVELGFRYIILHRDLYLRREAAHMEQELSASPRLRRAYRTEWETVYELP